MIEVNKIYNEPNLQTMARMPDGFCDLIVTDPPYALVSGQYSEDKKHKGGFMNAKWDAQLPSVEIWKECLRVLKPGAFAFIMCAPRQDVLSQMIVNLTQAGFRTDFTSLYHVFASGFPKASNISKHIDRRNGRDQETFKPFAEYLNKKRKEMNLSMSKIDELLSTNTAYSWWEGRKDGIQLPTKKYYLQLKNILQLDNRFDELIEREEAEREIISNRQTGFIPGGNNVYGKYSGDTNITADATDQAKALSGAFGGFQPKPALEVVLVVMKPLETKTFTEQAMKNGKGCTWLDDCRIPTTNKDVEKTARPNSNGKAYPMNNNVYGDYGSEQTCNGYDITQGRFPGNLIVSDDALNDGNVYETHAGEITGETESSKIRGNVYGDYTGHAKARSISNDSGSFSRYFSLDAWWSERLKNFPKSVLQTFPFLIEPKASKREKNFGNAHNTHNTVKPVKLLSYLITLGSREGEIVYDCFGGSGTTGVAAEMLNRKWILSEMDADSCMIAEKRLYPFKIVQKLF